jgi:hypothetical protein
MDTSIERRWWSEVLQECTSSSKFDRVIRYPPDHRSAYTLAMNVLTIYVPGYRASFW